MIGAVILCGGLGTRLRPYTNHVPKPLVSLMGRPILEWIIVRLKSQGVLNIRLVINHLGYMIQSYFGDGRRFGVEIEYVVEQERLGTAGALGLIGPMDSTVLVMNGDIICDFIISDFLSFHKRQNASVSIFSTTRCHRVPLGVLETSGDSARLHKYTEKPEINFRVSCGIYLFEPSLVSAIEPRYLDMPDLIVSLAEHQNVCIYNHLGYWMDLGNPEDLELAEEAFVAGTFNM